MFSLGKCISINLSSMVIGLSSDNLFSSYALCNLFFKIFAIDVEYGLPSSCLCPIMVQQKAILIVAIIGLVHLNSAKSIVTTSLNISDRGPDTKWWTRWFASGYFDTEAIPVSTKNKRGHSTRSPLLLIASFASM